MEESFVKIVLMSSKFALISVPTAENMVTAFLIVGVSLGRSPWFV